ncbi:hypothetical protein RDV78_08615 [Bacillota bacterium LX-D]|nr:hypothetical protein [Bacillota bacterium LX-D]
MTQKTEESRTIKLLDILEKDSKDHILTLDAAIEYLTRLSKKSGISYVFLERILYELNEEKYSEVKRLQEIREKISNVLFKDLINRRIAHYQSKVTGNEQKDS